MPSSAAVPAACPLTAAQLDSFARDGYLILDGYHAPARTAALIAECDAVTEGRLRIAHAFELPEHGRLVADPGLLAIAEALLGPGFRFSHFGTRRHDAGIGASAWHHDLSQFPQSNRRHRMIGMLSYLSGLDGTIGDLVLLPGSHRLVLERGVFNRFQAEPLPGEVVVRAGPGTLAVLDAAIIHCRRPMPGGHDRHRYLVDLNFCERGVRWPGMPGFPEAFARLRALGLCPPSLAAELLDESAFFDAEEAARRQHGAAGSLLMA